MCKQEHILHLYVEIHAIYEIHQNAFYAQLRKEVNKRFESKLTVEMYYGNTLF